MIDVKKALTDPSAVFKKASRGDRNGRFVA